MKFSEAIALRIRELLKKNHLTQYKLSIKSGVRETTISAIVRHVHAKVTANILYEISQGFEISLKEFFDSPLFDDITD